MHRDKSYNSMVRSEGTVAGLGKGLKKQVGWLVLIAGCALLYFSLPIFPKMLSLLTADNYVDNNRKSPWINTINSKINLPKIDAQGFTISQNRSYFVITIPGGGCYSFEPIVNASHKSRHLPFILILSSKEGCIKKDWLKPVINQPDKFLIVLDPDAKIAPVVMHHYATQAGWMSSEGRILLNPTGYQLLEEFLVSEVN